MCGVQLQATRVRWEGVGIIRSAVLPRPSHDRPSRGVRMRVAALPFDLWDAGYKNVESIDYSQVVIDIMKEKTEAKGEGGGCMRCCDCNPCTAAALAAPALHSRAGV